MSIRISSQPMPTPDSGFGKSLADRSDLNITDLANHLPGFLMCLPSFPNIFFGLFTRWTYEIIPADSENMRRARFYPLVSLSCSLLLVFLFSHSAVEFVCCQS